MQTKQTLFILDLKIVVLGNAAVMLVLT